MTRSASIQDRTLKSAGREELIRLITDHLPSLAEDEALAILENPYVTTQILSSLANSPRLTAFYSVRLELVAHRQTPQAHAVKLVHYLYWRDLLRLSVDVRVPAQVRRAIDTQLLIKVEKLSLGEKVVSARACGQALMKRFLFDPDPKVFAALLVNRRLREDDVLHLLSTQDANPEKLRMLADDQRWSYRYQVRKGLVLNPMTPRAAAAAQLRHLSAKDLAEIHSNPSTSTYLRRCIERVRAEHAERAGVGRLRE